MRRTGDVNDRTRWYKRKKLITCSWCHKSFPPWRSSSKYCSKQCSNKTNGNIRKKIGERVCSICHVTTSKELLSRSNINGVRVYRDLCLACSKQKTLEKKISRPWYHKIIPMILANCRIRAVAKGIDFNLTRNDIVIPERCPVFGTSFEEARSKKGRNFNASYAPSVDRIDNRKGYTRENIVIVSCRANSIKGDASVYELRKIVQFYENLSSWK